MNLPELSTCSYAGYRRDMGTAVRISRGAPRFISLPDPRYSAYQQWPYLEELAPQRSYIKAPKPEYERLFLEQLDRHAAGIERKLGWIKPENGRICLLCFEKAPLTSTNWCHRRMAADWLESRLGISVPELG